MVFETRGAVRQRDGSAKYTTSPLTNNVESLEPFYRTSTSTNHLIAGCGTRLEAITAAGATTSLTGLTAGLIWDFARYGTPGNESVYAGNGTDTIKKWSGAAWSSPANMPKAQCLAVQATDNRMVAGGFTTGVTTGGPTGGASTSSPSHVYFSDAGTAETWSTNNFVQLTPGDGEQITAIVAWREFVFVFKQSKFFVFYGNSVAADGTPIFNYRAVDTGVGCVGPRAAVAGRDGVYFVDSKGVYRTTGQAPELISDLISPIFDPSVPASSFYQGGTLLATQKTNTCLGLQNDRLHMGFTTTGTTNNRTAVFDPDAKWWTLWDLPATCLASYRISDPAELVFGFGKNVYRQNNTYANDDGTAITSRWRSGWTDFGNPEVKTIRESKLWGTGKVFMGVAHDFQQETGTLDAVNFGDLASGTWNTGFWNTGTWASPAGLIPALRRRSVRSTVFSTTFSNSTLNQTWSVHRMAHNLRPARTPSILATEAAA